MKKILLLILAFPLIIKAQLFDSAWIAKNYTKKEVLISMRDGINLFTSCYIPKNNEEKHPILLTRTPYSFAPYGENQLRNFQAGHWKEYLLENYIIITQYVLFNSSKEYMTDDQRFAARRNDVLVYQTETLSDDISFGGELLANLKVSISSTDADFVVKLIDVFPDDFSYATNKDFKKAVVRIYNNESFIQMPIIKNKYNLYFFSH